MQTRAGIDAQPLADQPAHGQATERSLADIQVIEQGQHIAAQLLDAVETRTDLRLAVAAGVVAQHPKMLGKGRHLGVPHAQVGAQGIAQQQHRRVSRTFELVIQGASGEVDNRHGKTPSNK
ncbi:hypothetical protein FQZ97_1110010 [compost metagenome]